MRSGLRRRTGPGQSRSRTRGTEELHGTHDVLRIGDASERDARDHARFEIWVVYDVPDHFGVDEGRRDAVHVDSVRRELAGVLPHIIKRPALARAYDGVPLAAEAELERDRKQVDLLAAVPLAATCRLATACPRNMPAFRLTESTLS